MGLRQNMPNPIDLTMYVCKDPFRMNQERANLARRLLANSSAEYSSLPGPTKHFRITQQAEEPSKGNKKDNFQNLIFKS